MRSLQRERKGIFLNHSPLSFLRQTHPRQKFNMPLLAPSIRIHGTTATFVAEPDADVLYSTDGREPNAQSFFAPRSAPVELGQRHLILKAVAVRGHERSPVATTMYVYTPRPLMIQPDDGVYDGEVMVHIQSDHDEIHYTTDGTVPSRDSPSYEGPFVLNSEGQVVVTAGMFVGDRLVGGIGRRTYEIAQARLDPPTIAPESGSYVVPLRITMTSAQHDDVRYTLDGTEPSLSSSKYKGPVVLLQEGDVTLKCRAYPAPSNALNRRPSETASAEYALSYTLGETNDDGQIQRHPVTVLTVSNVEFDEVEERMAGETAEKAVAMSRAAEQVKNEVERENASLRKQLADGKREHKGLLSQLDAIRKELGIAAARKSLLQSRMSSEDEATTRTKEQLRALQTEQLELKQQLFSSNVEVGEAERLLRQTTSERRALQDQMATLRKGLEEAFIENKKALHHVEPGLEDSAAECAGVLAEQRHELWLLKETLVSLQRSLEAPSKTAAEFMPQGKAVNLPSVEVAIPIPRGKLRLITGSAGTGLHALRTTHKVQAQIVQHDGELCVRVCGHANGVHNMIEQVARMLNE